MSVVGWCPDVVDWSCVSEAGVVWSGARSSDIVIGETSGYCSDECPVSRLIPKSVSAVVRSCEVDAGCSDSDETSVHIEVDSSLRVLAMCEYAVGGGSLTSVSV